MSITATIVAAAKSVSAWALKHKITVDAAVCAGERLLKAKNEATAMNLETTVQSLQTEIEIIRKEIEFLRKSQKNIIIISGISGIILAILAFAIGLLIN